MSRVDNAALALLEDCGISIPPVDVYAIAESLGVSVVNLEIGNDVSGMLIRDAETLTVGLHHTHSARRKRFTLAHEIGHLKLHRGRPLIVDSAVRINMRDATSARATDREEMEANRFAAALLMPEDMVIKAVDASSSVNPKMLQQELARMFDVSTEAMGYRLINLGITS
ncbi:ImmA/IrrE family metallo-endopeptidase [Nocardioides rubriscoriae]|uniref:ImmA/IrrE family metallo-endopeptidase n=1 Tax=Nocardioides rubriscoriae TaxID=642762 RepID=UPI0011DFA2EA|nr:ImmA/IrrE family metallo-endopeptidase [Nocardioides rubriscoriae]